MEDGTRLEDVHDSADERPSDGSVERRQSCAGPVDSARRKGVLVAVNKDALAMS